VTRAGQADRCARAGIGAAGQRASWHTLSVERVLRAVEADAQRGLSSAEAASRSGRFGPNMLAAGRAEPGWLAFIRQYSDPMQIVLLTAGVLSLFPSWVPVALAEKTTDMADLS